ncbi:transmembrane protein, putative (macronuclear) [Tetrahymena thermophila SB210]|uniref:Transmembrane protein, putative n=1 Tax=Tetrahymena thermophila (strain SB210) TaxID=312017 RepID=W7XEU5_TETTS|nr:transmembrane protein, putative [Tetrahymena thermophila SB210]EWS72471.1 transmembrane protein, putative [Tetrahymena thermophila SB210]|eukprot:XP_012654968.1 transmembrane protein, putative [Tetrahymena thermophila SB210]
MDIPFLYTKSIIYSSFNFLMQLYRLKEQIIFIYKIQFHQKQLFNLYFNQEPFLIWINKFCFILFGSFLDYFILFFLIRFIIRFYQSVSQFSLLKVCFLNKKISFYLKNILFQHIFYNSADLYNFLMYFLAVFVYTQSIYLSQDLLTNAFVLIIFYLSLFYIQFFSFTKSYENVVQFKIPFKYIWNSYCITNITQIKQK